MHFHLNALSADDFIIDKLCLMLNKDGSLVIFKENRKLLQSVENMNIRYSTSFSFGSSGGRGACYKDGSKRNVVILTWVLTEICLGESWKWWGEIWNNGARIKVSFGRKPCSMPNNPQGPTWITYERERRGREKHTCGHSSLRKQRKPIRSMGQPMSTFPS